MVTWPRVGYVNQDIRHGRYGCGRDSVRNCGAKGGLPKRTFTCVGPASWHDALNANACSFASLRLAIVFSSTFVGLTYLRLDTSQLAR